MPGDEFVQLLFFVLLLPRGYQRFCDPEVLPSEVSFQDPRDTVPKKIPFFFLRKERNKQRNRGIDCRKKNNGVIRKSEKKKSG